MLLSDTDTYKKVPRDPAAAQERKMNFLLLALNRVDPGPALIPLTEHSRPDPSIVWTA